MEFKQCNFDLKEFDESQGIIKAYANAYDFKDSTRKRFFQVN